MAGAVESLNQRIRTIIEICPLLSRVLYGLHFPECVMFLPKSLMSVLPQ